MYKLKPTLIAFLFLSQLLKAQAPVCPSSLIYFVGNGIGATIHSYDSNLPISGSNPISYTNIPAYMGGLSSQAYALMPNINGGTLSPTFYAWANGGPNYAYWTGTNWAITPHTCGTGSVINTTQRGLGGCPGRLYELVASSIVANTATVYAYNGTANASLVTVLNHGVSVTDIATDCNCNFYVIDNNVPQNLKVYNTSGSLVCSYSLTIPVPTSTAVAGIANNGGLALIGNTIYWRNNIHPALGGALYAGNLSPGSITFTLVNNTFPTAYDFASCPTCNTNSITVSVSSGSVSCYTPTASISASVNSVLAPLSYSWSGPGIVGSPSSAVVSVTAAGTYSCFIATAAGACPPANPATQTMVTALVSSNTLVPVASISPTNAQCPLPLAQLMASPSGSLYSYQWLGSGIVGSSNNPTLNLNSGGIYTLVVTNTLNGCTGTTTQSILQAPALTLNASANTLCAQNYNASANSISLTAGGALAYTLLSTPNFTISSSNGTVFVLTALPPFSNSPALGTATLIGFDGTCSNTISSSFTILPNPVLSLSAPSSSLCFGSSVVLSAGGASSYTWLPAQGLNITSGSTVLASPTVNTVYSVYGSSLGCLSASQNTSLTVLPLPSLSVFPNNPMLCLNTSSASIQAQGTGNSFTWSPAYGLSSTNGPTVLAFPSLNTSYTVVAALNTCTVANTFTVGVVPPPSLSLSLSSPSFCAQALNGSPNTLTFTAAGANTYTLFTPNHIINPLPGGPVSPVSLGPPYLNTGPATATLMGSNGACTLSLTANFTVVPNPSVALNNFTPVICVGESYTYTASGAGSYTWSSATPGSSMYTSGQIAVAQPSINSVFSVVGNSLGCNSALHSSTLTVHPLPVFSIQPNPAFSCSGTAVPLNAVGNASTYTWFPSTGLNQNTGSTVFATPPGTQHYTVVGSHNNCSNTAMASVSVLALPNLQLTNTQTALCIGNQLPLNVMGALNYTWSPAMGLNSSSSPNVLASPNVNTTYQVLGSNGVCTNTLVIDLKVIPFPSLSLTASEQFICYGATVQLTASGAESYLWSPVASLSNSVGSSVIASPQISTAYTLIGSNSIGTVSCSKLLEYPIVVIPYVNASISNSVALCLGEACQLIASGGNTYSWSPKESLNASEQAAVVAQPEKSTTYTVEISKNGSCGVSKTVYVQVNPNPTLSAGRDTSFNINEPMFIRAETNANLQWISGEGIQCSTCVYSAIKTTRNTCYFALATNEFNCKAEDQVCITITTEYAIYIPNSFTPNRDGLNEVFKVYGDNLLYVQLEVYDRWGHLIFSSEDLNVAWDGTYLGQDCPVGTYAYKATYKGPDRKEYKRSGNVNLIR